MIKKITISLILLFTALEIEASLDKSKDDNKANHTSIIAALIKKGNVDINEKYLGKYCYTDDHQFQEQIRRLDLYIKELVEKVADAKLAQQFFVNGWGQIIAALLLSNTSNKRSEEFDTFMKSRMDKALSEASKEENPFANLNGRSFTKDILMFPNPGKYIPFQKIELEKPIELLNKLLESSKTEFALYEGKLDLMIKSAGENIFDKIWATDFAKLLEQNGYSEILPNRECPHVTLVNSNVIAQISKSFREKFGAEEGIQKFNLLLKEQLVILNTELEKEEKPITVTELSSTYSKDYTPFEEVIVAQLKIAKAKLALQSLSQYFSKILEMPVALKVDDSFHVTIGVRYRKPLHLVYDNIIELLKNTGHASTQLLNFFKIFLPPKEAISFLHGLDSGPLMGLPKHWELG